MHRMPEELTMFVVGQSDEVLVRLLLWLRENPQAAAEEFEAVVSRQGVVLPKTNHGEKP